MATPNPNEYLGTAPLPGGGTGQLSNMSSPGADWNTQWNQVWNEYYNKGYNKEFGNVSFAEVVLSLRHNLRGI